MCLVHFVNQAERTKFHGFNHQKDHSKSYWRVHKVSDTKTAFALSSINRSLWTTMTLICRAWIYADSIGQLAKLTQRTKEVSASDFLEICTTTCFNHLRPVRPLRACLPPHSRNTNTCILHGCSCAETCQCSVRKEWQHEEFCLLYLWNCDLFRKPEWSRRTTAFPV